MKVKTKEIDGVAYVTRPQAQEMLGMSQNTFRKYENKGTFVPDLIENGNHYYTVSHINDLRRFNGEHITYRLGYAMINNSCTPNFALAELCYIGEAMKKDLTDIIIDDADSDIRSGFSNVINKVINKDITELHLIGAINLKDTEITLLRFACKQNSIILDESLAFNFNITKTESKYIEIKNNDFEDLDNIAQILFGEADYFESFDYDEYMKEQEALGVEHDIKLQEFCGSDGVYATVLDEGVMRLEIISDMFLKAYAINILKGVVAKTKETDISFDNALKEKLDTIPYKFLSTRCKEKLIAKINEIKEEN